MMKNSNNAFFVVGRSFVTDGASGIRVCLVPLNEFLPPSAREGRVGKLELVNSSLSELAVLRVGFFSFLPSSLFTYMMLILLKQLKFKKQFKYGILGTSLFGRYFFNGAQVLWGVLRVSGFSCFFFLSWGLISEMAQTEWDRSCQIISRLRKVAVWLYILMK
jgi:hypothetical protein